MLVMPCAQKKSSMQHFSGNDLRLLRSNKMAWWSVTFVFTSDSEIERTSFRPSEQVRLDELLEVIRDHIRGRYQDTCLKKMKDISAIIALCKNSRSPDFNHIFYKIYELEKSHIG